MATRRYARTASDPAVLHARLLPTAAWPADNRISLIVDPAEKVARRWAYLVYETAGTVLLEDEVGVVLPYTRPAGAVLPISAVAIVKTAGAAYAGAPTLTTADLVLYGHGG